MARAPVSVVGQVDVGDPGKRRAGIASQRMKSEAIGNYGKYLTTSVDGRESRLVAYVECQRSEQGGDEEQR